MIAGMLLSAGWMLVGTVVTDARSVAIIESERGMQQVLREADDLEGCVVDSIAPDKVVLTCTAGEWRLPLQDAANGPVSRVEAALPDAQLFSMPNAQFRALLADRQKLAGQISLEPVVAEGFMYGYRVASIAEGGDLAGLGIAPGDVITHVNGAPASEPNSFIPTIDALRELAVFSLDVDRNGERIAFTYVLE